MADFNIVSSIKAYCDEMAKQGKTIDFDFNKFQEFLNQNPDFNKFLTGGNVQGKQAPGPADVNCKILVLDESGLTTSFMNYLKYYYNPNITFDSLIDYPDDNFVNRFKLVNLKDYKVILVGFLEGSYGVDIINALMDRKDDIESWIKCGGSLISFADATGSSNSYAYLPLAVTAQLNNADDVQVTDPDNPIMFNLTGNLLSNWQISYHVLFSNIPDYKVLSQNNAGAAVTIIAKFGGGNIILTGQDPDFHAYYDSKVGASLLGLNMLDFACATCRGGCCGGFDPQVCCQVMLDHQTSLVPPAFIPAQGAAVLVDKDVHARVAKVCAEKVIIFGVLHKELTYTAVDNCGKLIPNFKKFDDEKFECFIDRKDSNAKEDDCFEIIGSSIMCDVCSGPDFFGFDPKKKQKVAWKFKEKDIIKVCVRKVVKDKDICKG